MPPTSEGFKWRSEDRYITVTGAAFAKKVAEEKLTPYGPFEGYWYAERVTEEGSELWRAAAGIDDCVEQTAATSNPAAGTISVDVKTFTGRGRVSYVEASCVADANVATRVMQLYKVSGANSIVLSQSPSFVASATGTLRTAVGFTATQGAAYSALAQCDFGPGDILRLTVISGQAGDDMSAITYSFKETV